MPKRKRKKKAEAYAEIAGTGNGKLEILERLNAVPCAEGSRFCWCNQLATWVITPHHESYFICDEHLSQTVQAYQRWLGH